MNVLLDDVYFHLADAALLLSDAFPLPPVDAALLSYAGLPPVEAVHGTPLLARVTTLLLNLRR